MNLDPCLVILTSECKWLPSTMSLCYRRSWSSSGTSKCIFFSRASPQFSAYSTRALLTRTARGICFPRYHWSALRWCSRSKCRHIFAMPLEATFTVCLHIMQKKQCLFLKGSSVPVANKAAREVFPNNSSVNVHPLLSAPLDEKSLADLVETIYMSLLGFGFCLWLFHILLKCQGPFSPTRLSVARGFLRQWHTNPSEKVVACLQPSILFMRFSNPFQDHRQTILWQWLQTLHNRWITLTTVGQPAFDNKARSNICSYTVSQ